MSHLHPSIHISSHTTLPSAHPLRSNTLAKKLGREDISGDCAAPAGGAAAEVSTGGCLQQG